MKHYEYKVIHLEDGTEHKMTEFLKHVPSPLKNKQVILLLLNYFLGYMFLYPFVFGLLSMLLFGAVVENIVNPLIYMGVLISSLYLAKPLLIESYQAIKGNFVDTFKKAGIYMVLMYLTMLVLNIIALYLSGMDTSNNQTEIIGQMVSNPFLTIFAVVVFAPIVEEIVFRGAIFRHLRTKRGFAFATIISFILFGLLHVVTSLIIGDFKDLYFLITYMGMAVYFCVLYEKTGNIYAPMILHALNNGISTLFILLGILMGI